MQKKKRKKKDVNKQFTKKMQNGPETYEKNV